MTPKQEKHQPVFDVFPSYKGGRTTEYGGYVWEELPGHHLQNLWGYVAQHRLVAEDILGRELLPGETVHHIDECRSNNSRENLVVMGTTAHRRYHARKAGLASRSPITRKMVREALRSEGGIKPAARLLKVSHSTLRGRYPGLCKPYQRTSPTVIDNPRDIDIVLAAAPDPKIGLREIMAAAHMSAMTILRICRRRGVTWVKKTKAGEIHRTYRGKPTRRSLESSDSDSAPAGR
jgi:hypothetical protein